MLVVASISVDYLLFWLYIGNMETQSTNEVGNNTTNVTEARSIQITGEDVTLEDFINGGEPKQVKLESLRPTIEALAGGTYEDGVVHYGDNATLIVSKDLNPAVLVKIALALGDAKKE
jgi:hypothetical protein